MYFNYFMILNYNKVLYGIYFSFEISTLFSLTDIFNETIDCKYYANKNIIDKPYCYFFIYKALLSCMLIIVNIIYHLKVRQPHQGYNIMASKGSENIEKENQSVWLRKIKNKIQPCLFIKLFQQFQRLSF